MSETPIFLVSTGRTGTRFFSQLFKTSGKAVAPHHTTKYTRLLNVLNNLLYLGLLPAGFVRHVWHRLKVPAIRQEQRRYIECNPYYFNILNMVWASFPEARVIFVIRHPREFVISHIKWERQRWQSRIANQLVPFWGPVGYHEQLLGIFGDLSQRVRYYSKVWHRKNLAILDAIEGKEKAWTCRFEDIFQSKDGANRLTELFHWLGVDSKQPINPETLSVKINRTREADLQWDSHCDEIILHECGKLMERFGYEI